MNISFEEIEFLRPNYMKNCKKVKRSADEYRRDH